MADEIARRDAVEGVIECNAMASSCRCNLHAGHEGVHECEDQTRCGGQWLGDIDGGDFAVVRLPMEVFLGF